jgi:hypothetical protein
MTNSDLDPRQRPGQEPLRLAADVVGRLVSDPLVIARFCDPLPADSFSKGAILLQRRDLLWGLVRKSLGLGIPPSPARPRRLKRRHKDNAPHSENRKRVMKRAMQQRSGDEKIDKAIAAVIREMCAEVRAGTSRAAGYNPKTGEREAISDAKFFKSPKLLDVLANQVGRHADVMIERKQGGQPQLERGTEPVMHSGAPGRPTSMHLVEAELDRRIKGGSTWPSKVAAGRELSEWLRANHKDAPQLTPKTITNHLRRKIPIRRGTTGTAQN